MANNWVPIADLKGDKGDKGDPGDAIEHVQVSPSASWSIPVPVSFNRRPSVTVYLETGELVDADVTANSTAVSIQFPAPVAGTAVLT